MSNIEQLVDERMAAQQALRRFGKLFITGCAKSGTTWLMKSLDGHPQVVVNGEGRFAWRLFGFLRDAVSAFNADHGNPSPLGLVTGADYVMMIRTAADNTLLRYLAASGKPLDAVRVVGDKTPQHAMNAELLLDLYPGCKFINIVRDPRDAATSALFHLAKTDPRPTEAYVTHFIGEVWRQNVEAAVNSERAMGTGTYLNVRYEDMHADPVPVIRRCLRHLNVGDSDAEVSTCIEAGSFERMSGGRSRGQVDPNALCRNGQVGDWHNHLSVDLARSSCARVLPLMRHFGYRTDDMEIPSARPRVIVTLGPGANLRRPSSVAA